MCSRDGWCPAKRFGMLHERIIVSVIEEFLLGRLDIHSNHCCADKRGVRLCTKHFSKTSSLLQSYGAAFAGLAPLLTMLNSCSPGVSVVNIDNGFGAAICAGALTF